jgi:hypothetical protein
MLIVSNSLGTDRFLFAVSEVRTALLKMDGQDGPVSGGDSSGFPAVRVRFSVGLSRVLLIRADGGTVDSLPRGGLPWSGSMWARGERRQQ